MRDRSARFFEGNKGLRLWVMIGDHYEPYWRNQDDQLAKDRVALWSKHWPEVARKHADSLGRPAQYCFFYPQEEYRPWLLDPLAEMSHQGFGDVEIHIHHGGEGEQAFIERMSGFQETLHTKHGLLRKDAAGKLAFGFIHGNWALDNSRPDGLHCGLNNELTILRDLGCYADFTMPSGNSPTQSRIVNQVYWATDDPHAPRSFDQGEQVTAGGKQKGDLLMVCGPFGLRWQGRPWKPRLETGELAWNDGASPYRIRRWAQLAPRIGNDVFIKLYAHGTQERNSKRLLLDGELDNLFRTLMEVSREEGWQCYFSTAWQMRQAIEAAQRGADPTGVLR